MAAAAAPAIVPRIPAFRRVTHESRSSDSSRAISHLRSVTWPRAIGSCALQSAQCRRSDAGGRGAFHSGAAHEGESRQCESRPVGSAGDLGPGRQARRPERKSLRQAGQAPGNPPADCAADAGRGKETHWPPVPGTWSLTPLSGSLSIPAAGPGNCATFGGRTWTLTPAWGESSATRSGGQRPSATGLSPSRRRRRRASGCGSPERTAARMSSARQRT